MALQQILFYALALGLSGVSANYTPGNHTIDDAHSLITYSSGWTAQNDNTECSGCIVDPAPASIYLQTWHDAQRTENATDPVYFQYTFNGTAIYIYGIFVNIIQPNVITIVNLTLTLDGQKNYTFQHRPLDANSYRYNANVFAIDDLSNESHTIQVSLNPRSRFLFDYLIFTTPDEASTTTTTTTTTSATVSQSVGSQSQGSNSSSTSLSHGAIAGIVVGVLAGIAILFVLIGFLRYRQREHQLEVDATLPTAFHSDMEPHAAGRPHDSIPNSPTSSHSSPLRRGSGADKSGRLDSPVPLATLGLTEAREGFETMDSALNSKQRHLLAAQRYVGGSSGGGARGGIDIASHTGSETLSSSTYRSHPYPRREAMAGRSNSSPQESHVASMPVASSSSSSSSPMSPHPKIGQSPVESERPGVGKRSYTTPGTPPPIPPPPLETPRTLYTDSPPPYPTTA